MVVGQVEAMITVHRTALLLGSKETHIAGELGVSSP